MQHHMNLLSLAHWLIFYFLSKKYLRQVKYLKIIFTNVISILKVDETIVQNVFRYFHVVPKLRFAANTFFQKSLKATIVFDQVLKA